MRENPSISYVYTLSTYEEHGAESLTATLSREKLPDLLRELKVRLGWRSSLDHELAALDELLARSDADLATPDSGHDLSRGWGGFQLHVCVLR